MGSKSTVCFGETRPTPHSKTWLTWIVILFKPVIWQTNLSNHKKLRIISKWTILKHSKHTFYQFHLPFTQKKCFHNPLRYTPSPNQNPQIPSFQFYLFTNSPQISNQKLHFDLQQFLLRYIYLSFHVISKKIAVPSYLQVSPISPSHYASTPNANSRYLGYHLPSLACFVPRCLASTPSSAPCSHRLGWPECDAVAGESSGWLGVKHRRNERCQGLPPLKTNMLIIPIFIVMVVIMILITTI